MSEDDFSIREVNEELYTCCIVSGSVLSSSFRELQVAIEKILEERVDKRKYIIIDFSGVTMFTSTCINVINSRIEQIKNSMWDLVIISPKQDASNLLEMTGLCKIYPVYPSLETFLKEKGIK
jgi:anti-anti-sigma factor